MGLYQMIPQNMLCTCEENQAFLKNNLKLEAAVDVNNCLEQIELHDSLHAYSELPSCLISTITLDIHEQFELYVQEVLSNFYGTSYMKKVETSWT